MKKMLLVLALAGTSFVSNAQDYYHAIGAKINYSLYSSTGNTSAIAVPGIVYKASLLFENRRGPSFAISGYPFVGLNMAFNSQTGGSGSFGAELPVLGEIVLGDLDDACFYAGVGFSASYSAYSDPWFGGGSGSILGPQVGLGGQFEIAGRLYGVRLSYTYGVNRGTDVLDIDGTEIRVNKQMIGLAIHYPFGQ